MKERKLNKLSNRSKVLLGLAGIAAAAAIGSYLSDLRAGTDLALDPMDLPEPTTPPEIIDPIT